jgi:hypothetical protein
LYFLFIVFPALEAFKLSSSIKEDKLICLSFELNNLWKKCFNTSLNLEIVQTHFCNASLPKQTVFNLTLNDLASFSSYSNCSESFQYGSNYNFNVDIFKRCEVDSSCNRTSMQQSIQTGFYNLIIFLLLFSIQNRLVFRFGLGRFKKYKLE